MVKTRLSFLAILFISLLFIQVAPVSAHGPSEVHLDYDFGTQVLTVDVSHNVVNPSTHYILQIVVEKNSVVFTTRDYTSQPSSASIIDTFNVPAVDGDVLRVTAICNLAGQLSESITVSDPSATTTTATETTTTTATDTTDTTTDSGSTTTTAPPTDMDSNFVILAVGVGAAIIIIFFVAVVKRR